MHGQPEGSSELMGSNPSSHSSRFSLGPWYQPLVHHAKGCSQGWREHRVESGKPGLQEVIKTNSLEKATSYRRGFLITVATRSNVGHQALVPVGREEPRGKYLTAGTWTKACTGEEKNR